ncbi:MAG: hypothetical protein JSR18_13565 [Proteobacteria bacterium]|nr:hypothetical protein [Pseudomonadota bacterium]
METTPVTTAFRRRAFIVLALAATLLLAWLAYVGYCQPELVFQLAAFRLC